VLHLSGSFGLAGAEQVIVNLARHADTSQWRPVVACLLDPRCEDSPMLRTLRQLGIETAGFHLRSRFDPRGIRLVRDFLKQRQVSVLHCHGYKPDGYGWLAARRLPVARISTLHGWLRTDLNMRIYEALDRWVFLRGFHRVIAVSERLRNEALHAGHGGNRVLLVPNGLDLSRFPLRRGRTAGPLPLDPQDEIIGTVARVCREKGHRHLLLAATHVLRERPRARFVFVGGGAEEPNIRQRAAELGVAHRVLFAGLRSDVPQVLPQFDAFVLPSLTEGLPIALLEAMAVGVPVVATSVGDVPRLVKDGETGLLVPPADSATLADAILRVLADPQRAAERALTARALVERDHSARTMAARTEAVYDQVLDSLRRRKVSA
jgi:glycosyltransferase involved in cell wall biosynthesis